MTAPAETDALAELCAEFERRIRLIEESRENLTHNRDELNRLRAAIQEHVLRLESRAGIAVTLGPGEVELTGQVSKVVRLYAFTSLTAAEVGSIMHISANTVKSHLKKAYRLMRVSSRHELKQRAYELGLKATSGQQS